MTAGGRHQVALDSVGGLHTWGWNDYGQLGKGFRVLSVPGFFTLLYFTCETANEVGESTTFVKTRMVVLVFA